MFIFSHSQQRIKSDRLTNTKTAIAPFLFAKHLNLDFPNKLIYVVPLRTLANTLRQRTETLIANWERVFY
ncbi:MAG: hypothetical protein V7L05_32075 [Nostoc sp.]|uniref:hypothetical protein n=1 Tax=Nostoc sp. TaxID=1180 RepID=UPI002FFACD17